MKWLYLQASDHSEWFFPGRALVNISARIEWSVELKTNWNLGNCSFWSTHINLFCGGYEVEEDEDSRKEIKKLIFKGIISLQSIKRVISLSSYMREYLCRRKLLSYFPPWECCSTCNMHKHLPELPDLKKIHQWTCLLAKLSTVMQICWLLPRIAIIKEVRKTNFLWSPFTLICLCFGTLCKCFSSKESLISNISF